MDSCNEKIWVQDVGDGMSDYERCGGTYWRIGNTELRQCDSCKKVRVIEPN